MQEQDDMLRSNSDAEYLLDLEFTAMTYNAGNGLASPDHLVSMLRSSDADIIALQELEISQSKAIEESLSREYPYRVLHPGGFEGKGLISRFPIAASEQIRLHPVRPDLKVVIDLLGMRLTVIVAHPPPPICFAGIGFDERARAQITGLIDLATSSLPSVILGDFNAISRQQGCSRMRDAGLLDSFQLAGMGPGCTLPVRFGHWRRLRAISRMLRAIPLVPLFRADYIWHTPDLRARRAWVGDDAGSDHLPVLVRLALAHPPTRRFEG